MSAPEPHGAAPEPADAAPEPADAAPEPAAARPAEPVRITPHRDGPLIVRGAFSMTDQDGNEIVVGRTPVALCRCGKSRSRPFCDGTHQLTRFRAPSAPESR